MSDPPFGFCMFDSSEARWRLIDTHPTVNRPIGKLCDRCAENQRRLDTGHNKGRWRLEPLQKGDR